MAAFRRCVIALAVLAIFAGLASAQQTVPMTCNLSSLNAAARAESKTDLVSDLLLTCTGGTVNVNNTAVAPTVNFTLTLPQAITSRIVGTSPSGLSDALLLIDDPQAQPSPPALVANYGSGATPIVCSTPSTGCSSFPNVSGGVAVMTATSVALGAVGSSTSAPNVYQGVVSGNSVTFFGVPVVPPGSTSTRTYRISNVRENESAGTTGPVIGTLQVQGGNASLITLNQTQATLATVQSGETVKSSPLSLSNCAANTYSFAGTVSFSEAFASGFRTRQTPNASTSSGQYGGNVLTQNQIGAFFSESGYEIQLGTNSSSAVAGLADFGTRLKAVFNNIPSGARVFVSFTNMTSTNTTPGSVSAGLASAVFNTAGVGNNTTTLLAELISGAENTVGFAPATFSSTNSTVGPGSPAPNSNNSFGPTLNPAAAGSNPSAGFPYVELSVSGGSATAVWEILNTNTSANETATFDVFVITPAQQPTGTASVNLSYAPTVSSTTIPSFVDPNAATPLSAFSITQCKTTLLYPYVTSAGGFDTGMAVANTTTDTFGTTAQSGTCQFTLYGLPTPIPTLAASPTVASGTVYAFALSQFAPGFTGYAIAVCNFQFAHGFSFVADWSSTIQSSAMGYLALILNYTGSRSIGGGLTNTAAEVLGQ